MFGFGFGEVILIVFLGVFFFGYKKIPQLGSALGKTMRAYRAALGEEGGPGEKGASGESAVSAQTRTAGKNSRNAS